jgi:flavorubredoxin
MSETCDHRPNPLPREIAPGVFWLGDCLEQRARGRVYHTYNAAFLVCGSKASALIETGHPKDFPIMDQQMRQIMAQPGRAPLRYLFLTHEETPHSGGLGRVLEAYPEVTAHGDMTDYHLAFPKFAGRMFWMQEGDALDLGDRQIVAAEPVIRDLRTTFWGFDTGARCLFPGDGFAYSHYHQDGHCGLVAEEAQSLDLGDVSAVFAEKALFWTKFVDMKPYIAKMVALCERLDVQLIAPTHGLPILDVKRTVPLLMDGLEYGSQAPMTPTVDIESKAA